jgi:hypothetical protein
MENGSRCRIALGLTVEPNIDRLYLRRAAVGHLGLALAWGLLHLFVERGQACAQVRDATDAALEQVGRSLFGTELARQARDGVLLRR